jgi:predicted small metal-binding protein
MTDAIKHSKEVHNYTDEQINDPEMMKKVKSAIKEE